jgi:dTDP-4-dehydrorhamnose reductase
VDDQCGGPTAAADIVGALTAIATAFRDGRGASGVFHFCGAPATSWRGFAVEIFRRASWIATPEIAPVASEDWPTAAERPRNSTLDCGRIRAVYGIEQPDWRPALDRALAEMRETV